ncbi:hypothetical protein RDWZM_005279 [Blomia tropicalis]|uniref:Uncharacterized protein n=1 Tax=Blomia tropicalis TaxID=40697 RepID=A0A9Q0M893_BLOTA|nr:hypothetical protein RDWZM_005279 [Blomia tropicalis]
MNFHRIFDNTCFRRCLYQKMKNLVEQYQTPYARKQYIIDTLLFVYGGSRVLYVSYMMKTNYETNPSIPYKIERDDAFLSYMKQNSDIYNEVAPLIMVGLGIFNFLCQSGLYRLDINKKVWKFWYQMLVTNEDDYNRLKIHNYQLIKTARANEIGNRFRRYRIASMVPDFIINSVALILSWYSIHTNLECIDREKFLALKITDPPNMPIKYRVKLMNILIIGDNFWFGFQIFVLCFVLTFYIFSGLRMDTSEQAWYAYIIVNLEVVLCMYLVSKLIQNGIFFTTVSYMATTIFTGHVQVSNKSIWNLIYESRYNRPVSKANIPYRKHRIVYNQLQEYNRITSLVLDGSNQVFGAVLYYFLLTNIPINIFLLSRGVFEDQSTIEEALSWTIVYGQLIAMVIVFSLLSWSTAVYHKPSKFIPVLQPMLKGNSKWLWYKIKYNDLYHRLVDDGPKIGVAFGDMHTVTYVTSFEVII